MAAIIKDMTEDQSETEAPAATQAEIDEYWELRNKYAPDTALSMLVSTIDRLSDAGVGITVTVGGTQISGRLTARRKWLEEYRAVLGEDLAFIPAIYDALWDVDDERSETEETPKFSAFLHLAQATTILPGGGRLGGENFYWRGRLTEIQGWSVGEFS